MNIVELMTEDDIAGTSFERPEVYQAYRRCSSRPGPGWVAEHLKRLTDNGIQPHFQLANIPQLETVERLIRRGHYMGPLNLTWVAIGGGFDGPNPYNMMNFINRVPDGATLTLETLMRSVLPVNTMAIAMGLHARNGNEDTLWGRRAEDDLGPAGRAGRPHRQGARPRGRHRQGSPRHLPHRRSPTTASTRRSPAWATRPTASPASSASPSTPERTPLGGNAEQARTGPRGARANHARAPRPYLNADDDVRTASPASNLETIMSTLATDTRVLDRPSLTAPAGPTRSRVFPLVVFVLTFGLLLSDYMSRQVLSAVFPFLKVEWALTDTQLGALTSIVALTVGLLAIPLSLLGDRWGRSKAIIAMAGLWSFATLGSAIAANYEQMMVARLFIGLGEAAYGSVGLAVVLMVFSPTKRASLTGAFMAGGSFGSVLGVFLGGILAVQFGWRGPSARWRSSAWSWSLLYALFINDPKLARNQHPGNVPTDTTGPPGHGHRDHDQACEAAHPGLHPRGHLRLRRHRACSCSSPAALFAWLPSYLGRAYGLAPDKAGVAAAGFILLMGLGMIVCGILTDRMSRTVPIRKWTTALVYAALSLVLLPLASPRRPGTLQLVLIAVGAFFAAGTAGPAGAMVANLTPASIRATAFGTLDLGQQPARAGRRPPRRRPPRRQDRPGRRHEVHAAVSRSSSITALLIGRAAYPAASAEPAPRVGLTTHPPQGDPASCLANTPPRSSCRASAATWQTTGRPGSPPSFPTASSCPPSAGPSTTWPAEWPTSTR